MPNELQQQLDTLNLQEQQLLVKMISNIGFLEDEEKAQQLIEALPENVKEVFFAFIAHKLREEALEKQKRTLKEKSFPIKADAIEILRSLITSYPPKSKSEETDLVDRAIRMAQAINDHF